MTTADLIELSEYDESDPIDLSDDDIEMIESQVDGLRVEYRRGKQVVLHTDHRVGVVALPDGPTIELQPKIGEPNLDAATIRKRDRTNPPLIRNGTRKRDEFCGHGSSPVSRRTGSSSVSGP